MPAEIQYILYHMPDDSGKVQVVVKDNTLWCTQKAMAQLFGVERSVITKHLKNIFDTHELNEDTVCAKFAHTAEDGKKTIKPSSTTSTPSSRWAIASPRPRPHVSDSGPRRYSTSIYVKDSL